MKGRIDSGELASAAMKTPIGRVWIAASERGITRMEIARGRAVAAGTQKPVTPSAQQARKHVARAMRQLKEYFAGQRREFDLSLDLRGTPHQQQVWHGLLEIPFGRTLSYGELAERVGTPRDARAVGAACGANPVWLVVPCHRAIGADGSLHGYGGGLWRKEYLLKLEGALLNNGKSKLQIRKSEPPRQRALAFQG